jgi:hypothetical protein
MLSQILLHDVESYAARLRDESPLLTHAKTRALPPDAIGLYLAGLRYLTQAGVQLLSRAAECAEREDDEALAVHLQKKAGEEVGHYRWADNDIHNLERQFKIHVGRPASPALRKLMAFLAREIEAQPAHFLAYALLVEHLTVTIGPEWLETLEKHSGILPSNVSVVKNHVDLDRGHVEEGLQEIDFLVDAADLDGMRRTIRTSSEHLDAFFGEVAQRALAAQSTTSNVTTA